MNFKTDFNAEKYTTSYVDEDMLFQTVARKLSAAGKKSVEEISNVINGHDYPSGLSLPVVNGYVSADDVKAYLDGIDESDIPIRYNNGIIGSISADKAVEELSNEVRDQIALTQSLEIIDSDAPSEAVILTSTLYPSFHSSSVAPIITEIANSNTSKIGKLHALLSWIMPEEQSEEDITTAGLHVANVEATAFCGFRLWVSGVLGAVDIDFNFSSLIDAWKTCFKLNVVYPIIGVWKASVFLGKTIYRAVTKGFQWLKKTFIIGPDRFTVDGEMGYINEGLYQGSISYSGPFIKKLYDKGAIINISVPGGRFLAWVTDEPQYDDEDERWYGTISIGFKPHISSASEGMWWSCPSQSAAEELWQNFFHYICYDALWDRPDYDSIIADYPNTSIPANSGFGQDANAAGQGALFGFYWWLILNGHSERWSDTTYQTIFKRAIRNDFYDYTDTPVNVTADATSSEYDLVRFAIGKWVPDNSVQLCIRQLFADFEEVEDGSEWFLPYTYTYDSAFGDIHAKSDKKVASAIKRNWAIAAVAIAAVSLSVGAAIGWRKLQNAAIIAQRNYDVIAFDPEASPQDIRKAARKASRLSRFNPLNSSEDASMLYKITQMMNRIG